MVHCVVLGGGISGLSLSYYLRQRLGNSIDLTILERSNRLGGWIHSAHRSDRVLELGPKSLRAYGNGKEVLSLAKELGLDNSLIYGDAAATRRFLYLDGKVQEVPTGLKAITSPALLTTLLPALLKEPFIKPNPLEDESIASFVTRRFGRDVLSSFVEPTVLGIYGGNCSKLSIKSCFPVLHQAEYNGKSVVTSMLFGSQAPQSKESFPPETEELIRQAQKAGVFSFSGGVGTLVDSLANTLYGHNLLMVNKSATSLTFTDSSASVELSTGETITCDHIFSTLPSNSLAELVNATQLSNKLNSIPFVSIGVVSMLFTDPNVHAQVKNGFGYLVPPKEHQPILGVAFDSKIFPQHKQHPNDTILSVMIGGDTSVNNPQAINVETAPSEQLQAIALEALRNHLGIIAQPTECIVKICHNAIPQYQVGHHALVEQIHSMAADLSHRRLTVTGNCFGRVGVPDCIAQAKEVALSWSNQIKQ